MCFIIQKLNGYGYIGIEWEPQLIFKHKCWKLVRRLIMKDAEP